MADTKVSDFGDIPALDLTNDRIPIIDASGTGTAKNKLIAPAELQGGMDVWPDKLIVRTTDQYNDTTTLVDDDTLQFTAQANTNYLVQIGMCIGEDEYADVRMKAKMVGPVGVAFLGAWNLWSSGALQNLNFSHNAIGDESLVMQGAGNSDLSAYIIQTFVVKNGANQGTVKLQFKKLVSASGGITMLSGSWMNYKKVS